MARKTHLDFSKDKQVKSHTKIISSKAQSNAIWTNYDKTKIDKT